MLAEENKVSKLNNQIQYLQSLLEVLRSASDYPEKIKILDNQLAVEKFFHSCLL